MDRRTPHRATKDEGFVLITALMVIFLVLTIVVTVTLVTSSDLRSAAVARAAVQSRITAESISDSIYASVAQENEAVTGLMLITKANTNFSKTPGVLPSSASNNPLSASIGASPNFGGWFYLTPQGKVRECKDSPDDNRREVCFRAKLIDTNPPAVGSPFVLKRKTLKLTVITRGACVITGPDVGDVEKCVYRVFDQYFTTRVYLDAALMTKVTESGLPDVPMVGGGPAPVAYLQSDGIKGNIATNQNNFVYCGLVTASSTAKFKSLSGTVKSISALEPTDFCKNTASALSNVKQAEQFLPSQITNDGNVASDSIFKSLADTYSYSGNTQITLDRSGYKLGANPTILSYPTNGVIYVNGALSISGAYSKPLSIYATGDITITGDILYTNSAGTYTFNGTGATTNLSEDVLLGLATPKDIILSCRNSGPTDECQNLNVVAVLNAASNASGGGHVRNNNWKDSQIADVANPPKFTLYGAIVSYYHPVFGAYTSTPAGQLKQGWAKNLTQDERLIDNQPPYFFRTTQATIVRAGIDSKSCAGASVVSSCN